MTSVLLNLYSLLIPFHSPFSIFQCCLSLQCIHFSVVSLCVSSLYFIGMRDDSLSLSLFVQHLSSFILTLHPSLSSLFKNLAENGDRRAPADFFFPDSLPFLNQNQVRRNRVITSVLFLLSPWQLLLQFCSRFMKIFTLKGSWSIMRIGACWMSQEIIA